MIETRDNAKAGRELGIEKSTAAAGETWRAEAISFLKRYLERNATMHCDDLWGAGLRRPEQAKGLGGVIRFAIASEWIVPIPVPGLPGAVASRPSNSSNRQLKAVWRSTIHQPNLAHDYRQKTLDGMFGDDEAAA